MPDPDLKLSRAYELAEALNEEIERFLTENPASIDSRRLENDKVEVFLSVNKEIPVIFSLMLGEILHNARSALDAAMYSLVASRAKSRDLKIEEHRICYKIENEPRKYFSDKKWHQNTLSLSEKRWLANYQPFAFARGVPEEDRDTVRKRSPLARLRDLSNEDKHRQLKIILIELNLLAIYTEPGDKLLESQFSSPPWRDGDLVYSYVHLASNPTQPIISADFKVALDEDATPMNVHGLMDVVSQILQHVRLTILEIRRIEQNTP